MTYPITPDPSIHQVPASDSQAALDAEITQLRMIVANIPKFILAQVVAFIKMTTGIDLSGIASLLENIGDGIGLVGQSLSDFLHTASTNASNAISQLISGFQGISQTDPGALLKTIEQQVGVAISTLTGGDATIAALQAWKNDLLTVTSQLNAGNLVGQIESDILSILPVGHIGTPTVSANLLSNPVFSDARGLSGTGDWSWSGPALTYYGLAATSNLFDDGGVPYVGAGAVGNNALDGVDFDIWSRVEIPYAAAAFPMGTSIAEGLTTAIAMIKARPGKFILVSTSQGSAVASLVYRETLAGGQLADRASDLIGAVTFGNPMREQGHTIDLSVHPTYTVPTGHGLFSDRLVGTPTWWWDFANPNDIITDVDDGTGGALLTAVCDLFLTVYNGQQDILGLIGSHLASLPPMTPDQMSSVANTINEFLMIASPDWPHDAYWSPSAAPLPGNPKTSGQLATDYINALGAANLPAAGTDYQSHATDGGSAKVTANGTNKTWNHPDILKVAKDQVVNLSGWVLGKSLVGTGTPLAINLVSYLNGSIVATTSIDTNAVVSTWTQLSGSYTVPAGVDSVQLQLKVGSTATAGTVYWDDLSVTKTGLVSQDWVSGLSAALSGIGNTIDALLHGAGLPTAGDVGAALAGAIGDIQSTLDALWQGLNGGTATGKTTADVKAAATSTASTATSAATGLQTNINSQVTRLSGPVAGGVATQAQADNALKNVASSIADNTAQIQALTAATAAANNNGASALEDFSTYADSGQLPSSIWNEVYSGSGSQTFGTYNGLACTYTNASNSIRSMVAIYKNLATVTDTQKVGFSIVSWPNTWFAAHGHVYLIGRSNIGGTSYIFVDFEPGQFSIGCVVAGAKTVWTTVGYALQANTSYYLVCGTSGGARVYQVWENTRLIASYTETGTTSQLGASYRYTGFGQLSDYLIPYTLECATLAAWGMADNTPATYKGVVGRVMCTSTATITPAVAAPTSPAKLTDVTGGTTFFDTVDYVSQGVTFASGRFTLGTDPGLEGLFNINARVDSQSYGNNAYGYLCLFKNGTIYEHGDGNSGPSFSNVANGQNWMSSAWQIYLKPGDYIELGYVTTTANTWYGDSTGSQTYFKIGKVA